MPLPPQLTPDQRQAALAKAGAARRQRAELKDKLKMGSLSLRELFDQAERDEVVGKMKVLTVLESLPRLGKVKARRLMDEMIAWCRGRRMTTVYLHASEEGRPLYESLGFTPTNEMRLRL